MPLKTLMFNGPALVQIKLYPKHQKRIYYLYNNITTPGCGYSTRKALMD